MEKVSKVDCATTSGIIYESKSIFLRQISYNLLTDIAPNYILQSQTVTIKVRANFPRTITDVNDTDDVLQSESSLIGKQGGNHHHEPYRKNLYQKLLITSSLRSKLLRSNAHQPPN